ncbi:hypothetical protein GLOIN_2v1783204 [Rhizophagus irregularis DAOM 181602=DAOM 197198]|nr:hypothetical protein GLOIN_2v1783204 [Rhizophagus irregularis DAOM 181602=DAOM 197198]
MKENYQQYMSKSCLQIYLLPRHPNSTQAKCHYHPALIRNVAVSRNEMNSHEDGHYCLASVKDARQFAETFPENSIIISQDDKAKVPLGIPAVGRTFSTVQSQNQPVSISDHDFPVSSKHKLIPSVYLVIDPTDTNGSMRSERLAIFASFLDNNNMHRPILVLLVDGGPDENSRHLKNIKEYCHMASLSEKLAGITLSHDKYGNHLRNGKVIDDNLTRRNFAYSGKTLCELWKKDHINGHSVYAEYISEDNMRTEAPVSWHWIETYTQICR